MIPVLNLDLGAGPERPLGGHVLMRRPAQHSSGPVARTGWAHPYSGIRGLAVFYNDGSTPPAPAPSPTPEPPKPGPPPQTTFTQEDLERIAAKEKSQGERAGARKALEEFAAEHGFTNVDDAKAFIAAARKAEQDALSEQERAQRELEAARSTVESERAQLAAERRNLLREQALSRIGAVDLLDEQGQVSAPNLSDALAMLDRDLRDTPDADPAAVAEAAAKLKQRRPELFGATPPPPPNTLPPAPGGAPAGGTRPGTVSGKPGDAGREMLRRRGKVRQPAT